MLYNILNEIICKNNNNYGKRNCKVFIYGVVLYCASLLILINFFLHNKISQILYDTIFWISIVILFLYFYM